jgi:ABC-type Fe3+ transport system permease subunit
MVGKSRCNPIASAAKSTYQLDNASNSLAQNRWQSTFKTLLALLRP